MNWKRKTITALCAGALCASVVGGTLLTAGAEAVDFAKDSTKWSETTNVTVTADGMYATANAFTAVTTEVGGNSSAEITLDFSKGVMGSWGAMLVYFKWNAETDAISWSWGADYDYAIEGTANGIKAVTAKGDWLALVMNYGTEPFVIECNNGKLSEAKKMTGLNGNDFWHTFRQTNTVSFSNTDFDGGVEYTVAFQASNGVDGAGIAQPNSGKKSNTFSSDNTDLWGDGGFAVSKVAGDGTFTAETNSISVAVDDVASDYAPDVVVATNYAMSASSWYMEGSSNTSISTEGVKLTGGTASALFSGNVVADSTVDLVIEGKTTASWGQMFVVFKNTSANIIASPFGANHTNTTSTLGNDSWLALMYGNSCGFFILECNNGTITTTDVSSTTSGYDYWYPFKQTNTLSITTTDTPTGVDVSIAFKASGYSENTGKTNVITYSSTNTALHGDYAMSVGTYCGAAAGEYFAISSLKITKAYTAELGGASLSMEGDVGVNMYTAVSNVAIANNASVSFQMDGETFATTTVNTNNYTTQDGVKYYKLSCNVAPKDYQKPITATLTFGSKTYTIAENFTIASYIEAMKDDATAGAAVTALGAYCEAARAYFAGETVAESTQDVSAIASNAVDVTGAPESCTIKGVSLLLDSNVTLRLYVTADEMPTESVTVAGEAASWTKIEGKNQYYVEITDIAAKDLGVDYTFVIGECTVVCNALDYVNMAVCVNTDANLVNLVKTLYTYHLAAYAYANA